MKLKLKIQKLEEVEEQYRGLYVESKDGGFELSLDEAVVPKSTVDEFRANNIQYKQDKEALEAELAKFKGIDPDKARDAQTKLDALADKKMIEEGKIEELLEQRVARMRSDFEGQTSALQKLVDDLTAERDDLNGRLSGVLIDSEIQKAVSAVGTVRKNAMDHILNKGRGLYKLVDGVPTPIGPDGKTVFGKDGKTIMSFDEWAGGLLESDSFLFEGSSGGGSGNDKGDGGIKSIPSGDLEAFGANLEAIAAGEVTVS